MTGRSTRIAVATIALFAAVSCFRNFAREQPKGLCEVHHAPLETSFVHLGYGRPSLLSKAYLAATKTEFPHSYLSANGGCIVNPFVRRARVRACAKCNKAEVAWLKTHPKYRHEEEQAERTAVDASDARKTN